MSDIDNFNNVVTFVISIISVITLLIGVIQWKMRNILKASNFQMSTNHDLIKLTERLDELCKRIQKMNDKVEGEIIQSREEHARMQKEHYELVKELYQLIGEVKGLKKGLS